MPNEIRSDALAALRGCRLWRAASDEAVDALAARATVRDVARGTLLASEGDPADSFGVLVTGRARVYYLGADGRQITFETIEATQPLAAIAAMAGSRYPAHIETSTPATIAWLPKEALFDLLEREPRVAKTIIADLAGRLVNLTTVIQTLALDVPSRLAAYLFQRSLAAGRPSARGLEIDLGMPKGELAAALGTVPETLSRAFARLRDQGIVEVHGRNVTVLDVRALAAMGSGIEE
ncbi:MAG: Crp/Fnr family transcriptional regulator [Actinomycetota bacterium]|nr:Crp/Fnr family transcriptional regulator [Actinomycetota bacterium]MDZ4179567.1 Crp/Fnr family transcriptional regulator [Coriobacteriia bacterium]